MREFNLDLAKRGHKVVTKNGHSVRLLCFNKLMAGGVANGVVALVKFDVHSQEVIMIFNWQGKRDGKESCYNLCMAKTAREGWVAIYGDGRSSRNIYESRKEAEATISTDTKIVDIVKVSWEE